LGFLNNRKVNTKVNELRFLLREPTTPSSGLMESSRNKNLVGLNPDRQRHLQFGQLERAWEVAPTVDGLVF